MYQIIIERINLIIGNLIKIIRSIFHRVIILAFVRCECFNSWRYRAFIYHRQSRVYRIIAARWSQFSDKQKRRGKRINTHRERAELRAVTQ